VVGFATGAATLLAELLIMLILSFYFMVDGARLAESHWSRPSAARPGRRSFSGRQHSSRRLPAFSEARYPVVVGGIGTGLIMSISAVDYALLASVVAGVVLLIPFLGPVVAVALPLTMRSDPP